MTHTSEVPSVKLTQTLKKDCWQEGVGEPENYAD